MPTGLDYSYVLPQPQGNGVSNPAFTNTSNTSSVDNLHVVTSKFMHSNSNLDLSEINTNPSPTIARKPGEISGWWKIFCNNLNFFLYSSRKLQLLRIMHNWRKIFRKKFSRQWTSSPRSSQKVQSTFGGFTTMAAWRCCCLTLSQPAQHGATAKFAFSLWATASTSWRLSKRSKSRLVDFK